ncbi:MAG: type II secretion system F family protein [Planctomycetes bacterium]|nr:type II secretion system F family protein [Planctomycetota bacterium]
MRSFEYVAVGADGHRVTGRDLAESELALDRLLERRGLVLTSAKALSEARLDAKCGLRRDELVTFTTQLATVTGAGVPIVEGLGGIGDRLHSARGKALVGRMLDGLRAGESLSAVLEPFPGVFPPVYRASVRAGEASGALDTVLERMAGYLEWTRGMRATTVQALIYPAILMLATLGLILVLLLHRAAQAAGAVPGGGRAAALADRARAGRVRLRARARAAAGARERRRRRGRRLGLAAARGAPRDRPRAAARAQARRRAAEDRHEPLRLDVLHAARRGLQRLHGAAGRLRDLRQRGDARGLRARRRARPQGPRDLGGAGRGTRRRPAARADGQRGERAGALDLTLAKLAAYYDEEVPRTVKRFLSLLEPALLLGAGAIVSFILMAAVMPLFQLYETLG